LIREYKKETVGGGSVMWSGTYEFKIWLKRFVRQTIMCDVYYYKS